MASSIPVRTAAASGDPRRVQLFVNPCAGSWGRKHVAALKTAFEAAGAVVLVTPDPRDRRAIAPGVDHVCAVGGDGTAREVAALVLHARHPPSMSVYPVGTVNLLARECGYSLDPGAFVRGVMDGRARRLHHGGFADGTLMLTCASVGPDACAVDLLSPRLKRLIGRAAYVMAFCRVLIRWPRGRLRVVSEGREISCAAVYVAKGRFFAGRWSFAPAAALDDPLLHVVALDRGGRLGFLRFAWALLRARPLRDVTCFTCTALTIAGESGTPVQADGDIVARLPVEIRLAAGTIDFA